VLKYFFTTSYFLVFF